MRGEFRNSRLIIVSFILLLVISQLSLYFILTRSFETKLTILQKDTDTKLTLLDNKTKDTFEILKNSFTKSLQEEQERSDANLFQLENRTFENFKKLQDFFNVETYKLKLNVESQLSTVNQNIETVKTQSEAGLFDVTKKVGSLEKKSSSLESKIDQINVNSADFSAIIDEVVQSVVVVKTNNAQGSGVIFDKRGYIMTNKHVIEGGSSIVVIDSKSKSYTATVIGTATSVDLAVLKIDATLPELSFADMSVVKTGGKVIAVGSPLGLSFTVTEGIISAVNRDIDGSGIGYIQTDVSINPGNSGGPLINSQKQIVGINTLKISNTEGLGFAIPANIVSQIGKQATG